MTTNLRQLFLEHVGQTSDNPMMLEVERAEGVYLYGPDGRRWIDLISGVSVSAVGHGNRRVIDAICAQARDYLHLMVYGEAVESPQVRYAERIASLLPDPLDTVYFVNSGSEAVEGALKLAKRYTGRTELVYYRNAYHGSTARFAERHGRRRVPQFLSSAAARHALHSLQRARRPEIHYLADGLRNHRARSGRGGDRPFGKGLSGSVAPPLRRDRRAARFRRDTDRLGRTGTLYFFQQYGVVPDILCTAKAFGGGMPLGAFIAPNRIMSSLKTNPVLGHITTFGGHPVCCAAGLAALEFILSEGLMEQADAKGAQYERRLAGHPAVREIRRTGLLMGVEFGDPALTQRIVLRAVERGLMTEWFLFRDTAMRIAPPLTITPAEIDESCDILLDVLREVTGS